MDFDTTSSWPVIIEMTATMLVKAQKQAWNELTELQLKRDILIREFFHGQSSDEQTGTMTGSIQEILDMDKKILGHCLEQKIRTSEELAGFSSGRRANNAYLDNAL